MGHLEDAESLLAPVLQAEGRALLHGCISHPIYKIHSCTFILKNSFYELVLLRDIYTNSIHVRVKEDLSKELLPEEVLGSHIICVV